MPTFRQTPAFIRYLKVRVVILKRPMFWVATSGLILSIFLVGEYLTHPQSYIGSQSPGDNDLDAATPPNQNPLGNLPTQDTPASNNEIFETLPELSTVPAQVTPAQITTDPRSPKSNVSRSPLLQEFLLDQSSTAAQIKPGRSPSSSFSSSFSAEAQRDRPSESPLPSFSSLGSPPSGFPGTLSNSTASYSGTASLNASPAINPLQSALDRYSPNGRHSSLSPVRSPSQPLGDNSLGNSRLSDPEGSFRQDSLRQTERTPSGLPRTQFTPQISPSPGTTGYTLPPTLRTSTPSASPSSIGNLQPIPGQIPLQTAPATPGQPYNSGQTPYPTGQTTAYPSAQPSLAPSFQPMPSPFSVPRAVPGRSIGGGQINTFSNP